jgi:hypothetical protein
VSDSIDAAEAALAKPIEAATVEKRWDIVAQLGRELEARRLTCSASNVVPLATRKDRSDRS